MAHEHKFDTKSKSNPLLARLGQNEDILREFNRATLIVSSTKHVTPAAEWLLDNFFLIEEQIQMARRHLPRGYSRELPRLLDGPSLGFPRVYDIVLELISHVDAQLDAETLSAFVAAYQTVESLRLGELWAIPIMLRLGLIENLQRITTRLNTARFDRDLADQWVDRLQDMAERHPSRLVVVVADMAKSELSLSSSFVAEFCQHLTRQSHVLHLARGWLEQQLAEQGSSIEQLVHLESQTQAADQVSVSHSITSLRFLSVIDWKSFVETLSVVEGSLRSDPAGIYGGMDFQTRDRYRHSVEAFARHGSLTEPAVAQKAVALALENSRLKGAQDRASHVGFYLIDKGRSALGKGVNERPQWRNFAESNIHLFPLTYYAGCIVLVSLLLELLFLSKSAELGIPGWALVLSALAFLVCGSQAAVTLVNWFSMRLIMPNLLPRMDYSHGIPSEHRTMVVVPTLLTGPESVDRLIEALEIHHLSNRDPNLHFALLTDFRDADSETQMGDHLLVRRARTGVEALNHKYALDGRSLFFLFHRPRKWNPQEAVWMGYERKRGKLDAFNELLRGGSRNIFSDVVGDLTILPSVKYVITLDTDTQLPRDSARRLSATMAHPLNCPVFDPVTGIVIEGYSILQPRVGVSLPSARRSWFVRLFAGDVGIDPYTKQVSDVYQDIFQEGSFIGKGIYDVDAFRGAMKGRFPENAVLSHDLLESCHARSALVSDVEFYEEHPSRYNVDVARRHRWIRGDWQIARWLLPSVPSSQAHHLSNPLSALSRWKIFDNLRRSLVPIAMFSLLLGNWIFIPELRSAGAWAVLCVIAFPAVLSTLDGLLQKPTGLHVAMHLRSVTGSSARQLSQALLTLAFLPYDAFISVDAIVRTLLRLLVTRRRLLEWRTSSDSERATCATLDNFYVAMWIGPTTAAVATTCLGILHPGLFLAAFPILVAWAGAPWIAWWISQPLTTPNPKLTPGQLIFLRTTARRTWHFFETFVNAGENWLPPDNFQEIPEPAIATRTSPTNMGLALLANLAASDFGYISHGGLILRTQNTLATMLRLERYRGHFYNWYETRTLQPLLPLYISSVDSGNLAGHLLTLASGLRELASGPFISPYSLVGLRDTLNALVDTQPHVPEVTELDNLLAASPVGLSAMLALLQEAALRSTAIVTKLEGAEENTRRWAKMLECTCQAHLDDLSLMAPWLTLQPAPPGSNPGLRPACTKLNQAVLDLVESTSLSTLAAVDHQFASLVGAARKELPAGSDWKWLDKLQLSLAEASRHARDRRDALAELAKTCDALAIMDFAFLFNPLRDLFSTGFNATENRFDTGFYDLLASEARLCSYVAIALGQVHQDHWFSMGRLLVASRGEAVLVSWSGSMFEYLMPLLVMPSYEDTLLERTCKAAVRQQIGYGNFRGVPWGISESGYNLTDASLNYQYRAFGVPGLGFKRGLAEDLVIAPYATATALMVAPVAACENLQRLAAEGRGGSFGFYEAVDYTASRLPPGESSATIRSFMAHHQGMSLLALVNILGNWPMPRRFMGSPLLKATDLLLQERIPKSSASVYAEDLALEMTLSTSAETESVMRIFTNPAPSAPEVHLLSNSRYHVVITSAGGGYSRWRELQITRWREDATRDCWGTFIYVRDLESGEVFSAAHQPTLKSTKGYEAIFTQARAEFRQHNAGLDFHTEISVSPEDDVELRRMTITNRTHSARSIELTSYAEVVLASHASDETHPAFSNLFVQTEFLRSSSAILCTRRAKTQDERPPWLLHLMVGQGVALGEVSCETDRLRFVGRTRELSSPAAMLEAANLSNTVGSVLDPIISLRRTVTIPAYQSVVVDMVTGIAETRDASLAQIEKYQSVRMSDRAFDLAWTHSQVALRQLNATDQDAQLYSRLSSALVYADPARRANSGVLRSNRRGQSGLWSYGISGDTPIVLLRISDTTKLDIVRHLVKAHAYWRMKGLTTELVVISEDISVYRQSLHDEIASLIASGSEAQWLDKPGGIFVRRLEQVSHDDLILLQAAARMVFDDEKGTLLEQMERRIAIDSMVPPLVPYRSFESADSDPISGPPLVFPNGIGGFSTLGNEYLIHLEPGDTTPAPWINVLANPYFGTVISESGSSYTWLDNSHEFRLTPWNNDPVQDTTGEAFYIRDEQSGQYWSPSPLPARGTTAYNIRHGFGYSVFEHSEKGLASEMWVYVAKDAAVKLVVLKIRNDSGRPRRASITGYWEWVLGELRPKSLLHVQTEVDLKSGALLARNYYNTEFSDRIAFVDINDGTRTVTGDRKEFIGRNGSLSHPAAMKRTRLSGKVGAGLDPCGAMQAIFDLADGQEKEVSFRIGVGRSLADVQSLIQRFRRPDACRNTLDNVRAYWNRCLGTVKMETPDPAVDFMANGWLLYQTLSCRVWARTGFYQSGGAYGFRDQLQDVMSLVHAEPGLTREHLLRAAAHQFREGDVQHWWHPLAGRGVRTHFSDDYLWLPYATCRYVGCLADIGVLDEQIHFIEGRPVKPEEESYYDLPNRSEESATLYEHCVRAINHGLRFGEHGLPLIGCGDWNDGMNRIGFQGRGESVWLGFFLYTVLVQFTKVARLHGDSDFADRCLSQAAVLQENLERHAWDGEWYRRAYFDNGAPLGSSSNPECQIDSLPQSWSVISGAGTPTHCQQAMQSTERRLVHRETGLIQLFDPPFDKSSLNPGYIKGYIPGVRENGGQYTHGAIWAVMAFALMGESEKAWELFGLLNPIHHSDSPEKMARYKVEPYVIAADVYAVQPHTGRGGWTWYTGSAGWMYRLLVETLLGINLEGDHLRLAPHLPKSWPKFQIHYRYRQTFYHITIRRLEVGSIATESLSLDGRSITGDSIPLRDDHVEHTVELTVR